METNNRPDRVIQHLRALALDQPAGTQLPSVRALMEALHVSPVTVRLAVERLTREGLLEARPGRGTFVAQRVEPAVRRADMRWQSAAMGPHPGGTAGLGAMTAVPADRVWALNGGYLPEALQPSPLLAAATARAMRRPGVWGRMPVEGLPALRAWFADAAHGAYQAHEVTICPGTQAAIATAFRALTRQGEPVLIESPSYSGALAAAQAAGLRLVPVPMDEDGVRPDALADAFRRTGARVFYGQPTYANPSGAVLSPDRREAVLAAVVAAGAFLIEDDWARDFPLDIDVAPPPLASADQDGHVIYLRSLTKCAAPGLRVGAMCARGAALERLRAVRLVDDFFVPGILQETTLQLVTAPSWPRHLRTLRAALRGRRDVLAAALRAHLGAACLKALPGGGLHLWVRLPDGASDLVVQQRAAARGLLVNAGRNWYPAEPPADFLRLSFAAADPDSAEEIAATLAALTEGAEAAHGVI
jgi:DNA-binding transcriptional MocR family regulator